MTIKILSEKIREEMGNFDVDMPYVQSRNTQTAIQLKALQTRILRMENYEKCWPHRCMHKGEEKITVLLKDPQLQGDQEQK